MLHLLQGKAVRGWAAFWLELTRQLGYGLLEIRIVACEAERGAVLRERVGQCPTPMEDLREAANRGEIFRGALEHQLELGLRVVEAVQLDQRPPERHARGEIAGVNRETRTTDLDRFLELRRAPMLLGELRKRNRRRIFLDPASKVFYPRIISHQRLLHRDIFRRRRRAPLVIGDGQPGDVRPRQAVRVLHDPP